MRMEDVAYERAEVVHERGRGGARGSCGIGEWSGNATCGAWRNLNHASAGSNKNADAEDGHRDGAHRARTSDVGLEAGIEFAARGHTSGEGGRVAGEALFFTSHARHACTPGFFLPFLFRDELLERREVYEPEAVNALPGDETEACQPGDIVGSKGDHAPRIARAQIGDAPNRDCPG